MEGVVVFLTALTGFATGVLAVSFFTAVGRGFLVPIADGFEAALTVFFTGVVVGVDVFVEAAGTGFFVAADDVAGVVFAGVAVVLGGSFFGTLFTGVEVVLAASVVAVAGFLTGVAFGVDDTAVLDKFPTLAG